MPTPLCQLARKYGSDKYSAKHSYTAWYWEQFKDRRESVRSVAEVGIGEGASLRMWREFFPNAEIIGIDNDRARLINDFGQRIYSVLFDQSSPSDMQLLTNNFHSRAVDLFIDDGSHRPEDQIATCLAVMPHLPPHALYVIEDVAAPEITEAFTAYEWYTPALERRRRHDNRLVVVKHHA